MRIQFSKLVYMAGILLALTFAFSCSSGDDLSGGDNKGDVSSGSVAIVSSSSVNSDISSSSSEGDTVSSSSIVPSSNSEPSSSSVAESSSSSTAAAVSSSSAQGSSSSSSYDDASVCAYDTLEVAGRNWTTTMNCATEGSGCYDRDIANCDEYGRMYNWYAAQAVCPEGFHLPSVEEWIELLGNTGGTYNDDIMDYFKVSLGGVKNETGYKGAGDAVYYWTSTVGKQNIIKVVQIYKGVTYELIGWLSIGYPNGYSDISSMYVRCVK
ncbi:hypothetical protein R83H12_01926 [Fibrobacteria bacterium R8-3-H12]